MLQYCFSFMFWFFGREACGISVLWPGIEPTSPALEREVPTTWGPDCWGSPCNHFQSHWQFKPSPSQYGRMVIPIYVAREWRGVRKKECCGSTFTCVVCVCLCVCYSKRAWPGTSLVVQWQRLYALSEGGLDLIPGWGTRSHMPQLRPSTVK